MCRFFSTMLMLAAAMLCAASARMGSKGTDVVNEGIAHASVKMFCWCGHGNFGDDLSLFIVQQMSCADVEVVDKEQRGKLLAMGSVMHAVRPNDVVWGTGVCGDTGWPLPNASNVANVSFHAVRGTESADRLRQDGYSGVPNVYGDPGLLLPFFYEPRREMKARTPLVLAHHQDFKDFKARFSGRVRVRNAMVHKRLGDWRRVVDAIASASLVFSSSLHGIIVAESYGIPAYHVIGKHAKDKWAFNKFQDYYTATGRQDVIVDLDQVLDKPELLPPWEAPRFDPRPLVSAFPFANCFEKRRRKDSAAPPFAPWPANGTMVELFRWDGQDLDRKRLRKRIREGHLR